MDIFDFISGEDFRSALESDYQELENAMNSGCWKAVHVLAGSIIEAMLVDYLIATKYKGKNTDELLRMDLAQAITACKDEGILSQRTSELSSVVRSYRNLIHPGRVVRLGETIGENSARIATSLVGIIVEEIAAKRRQSYGLTAEQIVSKVEKDHSVYAILGDLLKEAKETEIERLLLIIIPRRFMQIVNENDTPRSSLRPVSRCYRAAFNIVSDDIKKKAVSKFVTIIKEENGHVVSHFGSAFFRSGDLRFLSKEESKLVKKHLFHRMESISEETLIMIKGLASIIAKEEINSFVDALIRSLSLSDLDTTQSANIMAYLKSEQAHTPVDVDSLIYERVELWIKQGSLHERPEFLRQLQQIQSIFETLPF